MSQDSGTGYLGDIPDEVEQAISNGELEVDFRECNGCGLSGTMRVRDIHVDTGGHYMALLKCEKCRYNVERRAALVMDTLLAEGDDL